MFKMEIELNEQRTEKEGYNISERYEWLDNLFQGRLNTRKKQQGVYEGKGTPDDFGNFGGSLLILKRQPWFMESVDKWIWHTETGIEDLVAYYDIKHGERT